MVRAADSTRGPLEKHTCQAPRNEGQDERRQKIPSRRLTATF
jgi:hypothetical protein